MESVKMYFKYAGGHLASQMQYPTSFIMTAVGSFLASFVDVIALFLMFDRFKMIDGWSLAECCLLYGILHMSFALIEGFARGFDVFGRLIRTGQLDRLLVRPRGIILQVLGSEFRATNIGRFLQGLVAFVYALSLLKLNHLWQYGLIALAMVNSMMVFYALLLIQATITFWAIDSIEVMNAFTYGGLQMGQFPLTIYEKWFANFFTYLVPIALSAYFPVLVITGKTTDPYYNMAKVMIMVGPVVCVAFVVAATLFFKFGIRQYTSTGS